MPFSSSEGQLSDITRTIDPIRQNFNIIRNTMKSQIQSGLNQQLGDSQYQAERDLFLDQQIKQLQINRDQAQKISLSEQQVLQNEQQLQQINAKVECIQNCPPKLQNLTIEQHKEQTAPEQKLNNQKKQKTQTKQCAETDSVLKQRALAYRQILKEEGFIIDEKTDEEIFQIVFEIPKAEKTRLKFWVRVGQICGVKDNKALCNDFILYYKKIVKGQTSLDSNLKQAENNSLVESIRCDKTIEKQEIDLQTAEQNKMDTLQNDEDANKQVIQQDEAINSYSTWKTSMVECDLQNYATKIDRKEQIMIYEQNLSEQLTQAFQLILKEAGYTINGDDQLWIWQAVKSLSAQQRNQLKLWDRVVQICKLRDNKVAQQFFKQQCKKIQTLQNETNDRSQQELDRQNSEDIDVAQDLAQLSQDQVCCQKIPNEVESIQCEEEIQGITRKSQVQLPGTQILQVLPGLTENLRQAEQQEQDVKAQESQPVLENEQELEINIQTGILEQKARDLKTQIQMARAQFHDEQHGLKLAHETVKQLTAKSDKSISQSTPKENIWVQMKNDDYLPHSFEQPGQQHGDRKELLEQEIQHLQKQLELANKKVRNEQYKLKLVNETIANFICQNQQKTSEQNTHEAQQVSCVQQESYQKDIQESRRQSQQNLANDSHLSIQNQKSNLETSFNQLEPVPCDQQGNFMHNSNSHIEPSQSDQLTSNNVQQPYQPQIQLDHQEDVLNESGQQGSTKQQSKQYSSQQLLLRLAVKQTLKEAGYEVESLSEKEICKTVHKLTSKEKRQLRFWDRVAQLCCRSKQQIVHFYRQTYKSSVYKNKPNQRVQVDNQEQLLSQQPDGTQSGSQLISFALRKILTEIGYQIETASDKEICNHVDQMSFSQQIQFIFWKRVSILCQKSKNQIQSQYYRYKLHIFTDKSNDNQKAQKVSTTQKVSKAMTRKKRGRVSKIGPQLMYIHCRSYCMRRRSISGLILYIYNTQTVMKNKYLNFFIFTPTTILSLFLLVVLLQL
ncbi:Hypothetical_protein [Hexamita inflata]|uniref:Hypothetical_protein n=1 Tax=Hexamita inflata TaxID=28002 RepID=A0AA86VRS2_9EUKA|nr:Hypothetical protein HINF_LOCUS62523 [Hexamita inflata]